MLSLCLLRCGLIRGDSGGVEFGVACGVIRGVDGVDTEVIRVVRGDTDAVHLLVVVVVVAAARGDMCGTDNAFLSLVTRSLSRDMRTSIDLIGLQQSHLIQESSRSY